MQTAPPVEQPGSAVVAQASQSDAWLALRNAVKLGGSMLFTSGIALVVRLFMPRFLGPDAFGPLNFADAFAGTFFVALSLGIDTYIRAEVSLNPSLASRFVGGVATLRVLGTLLLLGAMQLVLMAMHRPPEVWVLVHLFGVAAFLVSMNQTFAALLHARGTVDELSVQNVTTKLLWAGGTVAVIVFEGPLWGIPAALVASELVKAVLSLKLVKRHLALEWRLEGAAVKVALWGSLPMFLNTAAHTIYNKLDVSLLAVVAGDREVAWYGASNLVAGVTLIVAPMIGWVLLPLFARARARSEEEYTFTLRRSLEAVLALAFPTSLLLALGSDLWIRLLYGAAYAPAAVSLRILAPLFILTYAAMLSASSLILTGHAWSQALISVAGLVLNPLLNWFTIPHGVRWFGLGGAGIGAASAQLGTEIVVTGLLAILVGRRAVDRRLAVMVLKSLFICALVSALDFALGRVLEPAARVAVDVLVTPVLFVALGAVNLPETVAFAKSAFHSRPRRAPPAAAALSERSRS